MSLIYLAEVEKIKQFNAPGKLQLLALKGANGVWIRAKESVPFYSSGEEFSKKDLVLVEFDGSRKIKTIKNANEELVKILIQLSADLAKEKQNSLEWKSTSEYITLEVNKRERECNKREADCDFREAALKTQEKAIRNLNNRT